MVFSPEKTFTYRKKLRIIGSTIFNRSNKYVSSKLTGQSDYIFGIPSSSTTILYFGIIQKRALYFSFSYIPLFPFSNLQLLIKKEATTDLFTVFSVSLNQIYFANCRFSSSVGNNTNGTSAFFMGPSNP